MTEITVTGSGRATTPPDDAMLDLHVSMTAPSAKQALDHAADRIQAVIAVLDEHHVTADRRRTQRATVHRQSHWDGEREIHTGWTASIGIGCTVDDADQAFIVLDAVSTVDDVAINGPTWRVAGDNPAHTEARRAAVDSAQQKAMDYAAAAGLTVGPLRSLVDTGGGHGDGPRPVAALARAASVTDLEPGDQSVTATVTLTFDAG